MHGGAQPRRGLLRTGLLGLLCLISAGLLAGPARADPGAPTSDPFHTYAGSLADVPDGTVLQTRGITVAGYNFGTSISSFQLLFRTTDELGHPALGVTTVLSPTSGATGRIASVQWPYDGLTSECDPSYTIQGGQGPDGSDSQEVSELDPLLQAGDTVVITDYESEDDDFAAGREEGQITLDAIRAAENALGETPSSTPVALLGYSGGSIASDWAAELAPSYAPALDLIADAMGGVPADLDHSLDYVDGSEIWGGTLPATLLGISRAFDIDLSPYLSAAGQNALEEVSSGCLGEALTEFPGMTQAQMLAPPYTSFAAVPPLASALNALIMGADGPPSTAMDIGVGDSDGTGDGVIVSADDEALASTYCQDGLPVQFSLYSGEDHSAAEDSFLPAATSWVVNELSGESTQDDCASVPAGDALAPIPTAVTATPTESETAASPIQTTAPAATTSTVTAPTETAPTGTTPATATTVVRSVDGIADRVEMQYRSADGRLVRLRLRALGVGVAPVQLYLVTSRDRVITHAPVTLPHGRLVWAALHARHALAPGRYWLVARFGSSTLADASFTVGPPRRLGLEHRRRIREH